MVKERNDISSRETGTDKGPVAGIRRKEPQCGQGTGGEGSMQRWAGSRPRGALQPHWRVSLYPKGNRNHWTTWKEDRVGVGRDPLFERSLCLNFHHLQSCSVLKEGKVRDFLSLTKLTSQVKKQKGTLCCPLEKRCEPQMQDKELKFSRTHMF